MNKSECPCHCHRNCDGAFGGKMIGNARAACLCAPMECEHCKSIEPKQGYCVCLDCEKECHPECQTCQADKECGNDQHGNNINNFGYCASCTPSQPAKQESKSFFDLPEEEKREIVEKAAKESNRMQQELMGEQESRHDLDRSRRVGEQEGTHQTVHPEKWEKRFNKKFQLSYLIEENQIKGAITEIKPSVSITDTNLKPIKDFIRQELAHTRQETEKAYGGCHKCYGKGYSTYRYGYSEGGDEDLGVYPKWQEPQTNMIFCTCDRGKQLKELLKGKQS